MQVALKPRNKEGARQMMQTDPRCAFSLHLSHLGLSVRAPILADGEIHRFHVEGDKPASKNGWYVLHLGRIAAGAYGSWRSGVRGTWSSRELQEMSQLERWEHKKRMQEIRRQKKAMTQKLQSEVASKVEKLWRSAQPANPYHPYLVRKNIGPHHLRQIGDLLLIPLVDPQGRLWNLQRINSAGEKRFLAGGRVKDCFAVIPGNDSEVLLVCEGFATGSTLREITGYKVLCAMSGHNLQSVTYAAGFMTENRVRLCADNDHHREDNPGLTKARQAARATGVDLTWPPSCGEQCHCTDFNDVANCPKTPGGQKK